MRVWKVHIITLSLTAHQIPIAHEDIAMPTHDYTNDAESASNLTHDCHTRTRLTIKQPHVSSSVLLKKNNADKTTLASPLQSADMTTTIVWFLIAI